MGCVMDRTLNISINSISGGGKTTLARNLEECLPNAKALYFDDRNYDSDSGIDDICKWIEEGSDINKFNLERLAKDIELLLQKAYKYIILDYPFGHRHSLIGKYVDISIYIDTSLDVALARRILRDYDKDSVIQIFDDMKFYLSNGRKAYLNGLDVCKNDADIIVDGNQNADSIIDEIIQKINNRVKVE